MVTNIPIGELRIGNKLTKSWTNGECLVSVNWDIIREYEQNSFNFHYEPIPLTLELFVSCGFPLKKVCISSPFKPAKKRDIIEFEYVDDAYEVGGYYIIPRLGMYLYMLKMNTDRSFDSTQVGRELKYLHQLQNIYFALMGIELKINI